MFALSIGALRIMGLGLRFLLTIFLVSYVSNEDLGVYSLIVASGSILPGTLGLGLSYFLNRQIVDAEPPQARLLARDRLMISTLVFVAFLAVALPLTFRTIIGYDLSIVLLSSVLLLEVIGFDLNFILIARSKAALAALLFFIRTSAWVPAYIALAYFDESFRNINALMLCWLGGALCFVAIFLFRFRSLFTRDMLTHPFRLTAYRDTFIKALPIWVSDIALALGQNVDRFIITAVAGVEKTGIYYFYLTMSQAIFMVMQSSLIQPYIPQFRKLLVGVERIDYSFIRKSLKNVTLLSFFGCLANAVFVVIMAQFINKPGIIDYKYLSLILSFGVFGRILFEFFGILDYAAENDKRYILVNCACLLCSLVFVYVFTLYFDIVGAATAFSLVGLAFMALRIFFWREIFDRRRDMADSRA